MRYINLLAFSFIVVFAATSSFAFEKNGLLAHSQFYGSFEYGALAFLNHTIQFGKDGTNFDYVKDGNQKILFPNWRVKAGVHFLKRHRIEFSYQPIFVSTFFKLKNAWKMDKLTFEKGQSIEAKYFFPFYRLGYTYDLWLHEKGRFAIGGGLQLRNATIETRSLDGKEIFETQSLGPVPLIILAGEYKPTSYYYMNLEVLGFWAPIRYLNGGSVDVNGWIYEATLENGFNLSSFLDGYINLRLIGGGAIGSSPKERTSGGKYNSNLLNTLSLNIGLRFKTP